MTPTEGPIRAPPSAVMPPDWEMAYIWHIRSRSDGAFRDDGRWENVRENLEVRGDKRRGSSRLRRRGATGRVVNHEPLLNGVYDLIFASRTYWSINKLSAYTTHTMNHPKLSSRPKKKEGGGKAQWRTNKAALSLISKSVAALCGIASMLCCGQDFGNRPEKQVIVSVTSYLRTRARRTYATHKQASAVGEGVE